VCGVATRERGVECFRVAPENLVIDAQILSADERIVATEIPAQRVERLCHDAAALLLVGIRPEEREQLAAGCTALTAAGDDGEDREPAWLRSRPGERSIRAMHGEAPKREESQHGLSRGDFQVIPRRREGERRP
jgi:hypothetical protein